MASNSRQLQQTLKFDNCKSECNSYGAKQTILNDDDGSSGIDYLRQEYHKSLDLNVSKPYPTLSEWQGFFRCLSQLRNTLDDKVGAKNLEESKRRCLAEQRSIVDGQRTNLDFILAPPAPVVRCQDKSPNLYAASWPSCQQSPVSLGKTRFEASDCIGRHGVPPFILMGCNQCFLYVMVSEIEPKCPNCQSYLVDCFRGNDAQGSRM
ncbi:hypothetical protein HS088_TW09G00552 [Tripterygium wilfordii]|uniref:GIR1-like zinc ribbon domain-containing protein n=1 Tax=Tripterygium wilfordii TaxID=458696 RepID=A0A7J7D848_TRIWF|nr:hypothetical protein HS088_TW09G00552 [Tripterygium wilfordii]